MNILLIPNIDWEFSLSILATDFIRLSVDGEKKTGIH